MLPVWYKAAKPLIESGKLKMLGVAQEQHAERTRLYKQWKQFDFPIAQDATTELNLWVVPIPILIDEHGIVRNLRPSIADLKTFVEQEFEQPEETIVKTELPKKNTAAAFIAQGQQAIQSSKVDIEKAIEAFSEAVKIEPGNGQARFGLGVAYRMRIDSGTGNPSDFQKAYENWNLALKSNPNQYIWRRRIEQYGPRLTKPYPFYDWIDRAIEKIKSRGEQPVELRVVLTGTEKQTSVVESKAENPDPDNKIFKDENDWVELTATVIPSIQTKNNMVRVHLHFDIKDAKWNNEGGPLRVWIDESSDGKLNSRLIEPSQSGQGSGETESRWVDFEFTPNRNDAQISGFVLFHCCDADGVCYYYRKDFQFTLGSN